MPRLLAPVCGRCLILRAAESRAASFHKCFKQLLRVARRLPDLARIQLPQNLERVFRLAVFTLRFALPRRHPQRMEDVLFWYRLNILTFRQRILRKPLTEESCKQLPICNEPRLHTLHHQVRMFVTRIGRALPVVAGFQVVPRPLRHSGFTVEQEALESRFGRRRQALCSNSQMRPFGCRKPRRLASAPRGPHDERMPRSRGGIGSATPARLRLLRRRS